MENTTVRGTPVGHDGEDHNEYSPWLDLAAAIVKTAADDYVGILRKLWSRKPSIEAKRKLIVKKAEYEEFFYSDWYKELTDIDPDRLIDRCRCRAQEKERASIERANRRKIRALLKETK